MRVSRYWPNSNFWWTRSLSSGAFSLQNQRPWTTGNIPCLEVQIWTKRRRHYLSLACFLLIHRVEVMERRLLRRAQSSTVVLVQPVLVVGHLNVPPKGNITLAGIRLDAQMKNWKLDVRFSSALSQRGPWVWIKWKKGDDASSWNDDLCTRPVYVGNLRTLRNQNITNFTADWKLWHLRSQHTSRGDCFKTEKKKAATGKHPFLIIAPVMMRGWLHLCPLTCFADKYPE